MQHSSGEDSAATRGALAAWHPVRLGSNGENERGVSCAEEVQVSLIAGADVKHYCRGIWRRLSLHPFPERHMSSSVSAESSNRCMRYNAAVNGIASEGMYECDAVEQVTRDRKSVV